MNHTNDWRHKPHSFEKLAVGGDAKITNIRCPITLGFIPKTHKLARGGIQLGVRRKSTARQLAVKVAEPLCLERDRVHEVRRRVLLDGEEGLVEVKDVGVGCGTDLELDCVCVFVSVCACIIAKNRVSES